MNIKRPVYRTCIITRESILKKDLFRLTKIDNKVVIDVNQKLPGRGVYIKKDLKVIELAHKRKALNKALRTEVDEELYISLIQALSKERRD